MTEREQWRERMRARLAAKAAPVAPAAVIDGETAAALAASSTRRAPEYKSYADPSNWHGRGVKGVESSRRARSESQGLTKEEWQRRQIEGVRRRRSQQREALIAAGERACTVCGVIKPLDQFRPRCTDPKALSWYPCCRPCESRQGVERQRRRGSKATMTPEEAIARRTAGSRALAERRHAELVAAGEKPCRMCKQVKPLSEYSETTLPSGRVGWHSYCRACNAEYAKNRYRRNRGMDAA